MKVTDTQRRVLAFLAAAGRSTERPISNMLHGDRRGDRLRGVTEGVLYRMERKGLVKCETVRPDRHVGGYAFVRWALTDAGAVLAAQLEGQTNGRER